MLRSSERLDETNLSLSTSEPLSSSSLPQDPLQEQSARSLLRSLSVLVDDQTHPTKPWRTPFGPLTGILMIWSLRAGLDGEQRKIQF
jgi:hypothetical protein